MITERHNLVCSMISKAIRKTGSLGCCFVCMDLGSSKRLTSMQNLQIHNAFETRNIVTCSNAAQCSLSLLAQHKRLSKMKAPDFIRIKKVPAYA